MTIEPDEHARALARRSMATGDAVGWFDELYAAASAGEAVVPWNRGGEHPLLASWLLRTKLSSAGRSALVVGCGFGFDADFVSRQGYSTFAFDVSPNAVRGAVDRHPDSSVAYEVADLFSLPTVWQRSFDLVIEIMTVQSLPRELRAEATSAVAALVAPGGTLLVIASAQDEDAAGDPGPPWPLTRAELDAFARAELREVQVEEIREPPGTHRWRARFEADV